MEKAQKNNWNKFGEVNRTSLEAYFKLLSKNLVFPITGEVSQEEGPFGEKTFKIVLYKLSLPEDDFYGILAEGKTGHRSVVIPIAEFSTKASDPNVQIIEDYKDWFWNNR